MAININKVVIAPNGKMSIDKRQYDIFLKGFEKKDLGTKRLGESFYEYFKLDKIKDQSKVSSIFAKDGESAKSAILALFEIT